MNYQILTAKEQASLRNEWLDKRLNQILPKLMKEENIDLWIIMARENNDDPVLHSLLPVPMVTGDEGLIMPTTRRWMFVVFHLTANGEVRAIMINGPGIGDTGSYELINPQEENEWCCLGNLIKDLNPKRIGLNYSKTFAHADGLSFTAHQTFYNELSPQFHDRCISAETLCVRWLEERLPEEIAAYHDLIGISHEIIREAFSSQVVTPSLTKVEDISWWMRQKTTELGLKSWFMPMVSIIRQGSGKSYAGVVEPGDMLHCDMGIRYLGLLSDTQQLAYILKPNEVDVPEGLKKGMQLANRLQDIHFEEMKIGLSGNQVLRSIHQRAKDQGIKGRVWTHPIGYHGHGAGPLIGTFSKQSGVPGRGEHILYPNCCYAMELCIYLQVAEWENQEVSFNLEETIVDKRNGPEYFKKRQTEFYII